MMLNRYATVDETYSTDDQDRSDLDNPGIGGRPDLI